MRVRVTATLWQGSWPRTPADWADAPWHGVLNVCGECVGGYVPPAVVGVHHGIPDGIDPGSAWFDHVVQAFQRLPKPVLVHCGQGISRSSAAVLAVLVAVEQWTPATAWTHLRQVHPQANPAPALWTAWQRWCQERAEASARS